jgi:glycolate oxidase iron-sulfur subunit
MCGLCIPHCPTYHLFHTENESPRGRIALFKALAEEQLAVSSGMSESLNHCLNCRACEKMCPSQVQYGLIHRLGKELLQQSSDNKISRPVTQKMAEKVLLTPALHPLVKFTSKTLNPVNKLISRQTSSSVLNQFTQVIAGNESSRKIKGFFPARKPVGQVILFKGCTGDLFEQNLLDDAIQLLNHCGYDVQLPSASHCCGALNIRQGDNKGLETQAMATAKALSPWLETSEAIIVLNNSCSGQLKEYQSLNQNLQPVAEKSADILSFLARKLTASDKLFQPLEQEIIVHVPCSLKNVLKADSVIFKLLKLIPGIKLNKLNDKFCCGAAGSYMLSYPELANRLLNDKIADISQYHSQLLVSSNLGCSLHFKQGLEAAGHSIEVIHPVQLLARQLKQEEYRS